MAQGTEIFDIKEIWKNQIICKDNQRENTNIAGIETIHSNLCGFMFFLIYSESIQGEEWFICCFGKPTKSPFTFLKSLDSTDVKEVVSIAWASPKMLKINLKHGDGGPRYVWALPYHLKIFLVLFQLNCRMRNAGGNVIESISGMQNG